MKTLIKNILVPVLGITFLFAFSSCQKDDPNETTNNQLDGDWEVKSWTLDGEEQIGFTINSFEMEFTKETATEGEVEFSIINAFGEASKTDGDYEIKKDGTEIDIEGDDLDLSVSGDDLEMSGVIDGVRWEVEADRD